MRSPRVVISAAESFTHVWACQTRHRGVISLASLDSIAPQLLDPDNIQQRVGRSLTLRRIGGDKAQCFSCCFLKQDCGSDVYRIQGAELILATDPFSPIQNLLAGLDQFPSLPVGV